MTDEETERLVALRDGLYRELDECHQRSLTLGREIVRVVRELRARREAERPVP